MFLTAIIGYDIFHEYMHVLEGLLSRFKRTQKTQAGRLPGFEPQSLTDDPYPEDHVPNRAMPLRGTHYSAEPGAQAARESGVALPESWRQRVRSTQSQPVSPTTSSENVSKTQDTNNDVQRDRDERIRHARRLGMRNPGSATWHEIAMEGDRQSTIDFARRLGIPNPETATSQDILNAQKAKTAAGQEVPRYLSPTDTRTNEQVAEDLAKARGPEVAELWALQQSGQLPEELFERLLRGTEVPKTE